MDQHSTGSRRQRKAATARRRVGLVDLGSNAIRTEIVEYDKREWRTLEKHRSPVRLGDEVFTDGVISDGTIARAVDALREFRVNCDQHAVDDIVAVATAATREARNGKTLLAQIRKQAGIEVKTISGMEEAQYLRAAVETRFDMHAGRFVLVDVGGGSAEIVRIDAGKVLDAETFPLGAVRLTRAIDKGNGLPLGRKLIERFDEHIAPILEEVRQRFGGPTDHFVATGGNIETIADLLSAERDLEVVLGVQTCRRGEVLALSRLIAKRPIEERMTRHRLRADRADTIVPAGLVYARLAKLADAKRIAVPRVGIKSGLRASVVRGAKPAQLRTDG